MINGFALSIILLGIVLTFFIIDFWYMTRFDRERESGKGWSWDYTLYIALLGLAVILQPWLLPWLGWNTTAAWGLILQITGMVIIVLSFGLHIWARRHLQRFYVERVEVQEGHTVINTGPYALMRHPIITTFFGLAIGVFMINPSVPTLGAVIYAFWDFLRAAKQEEEALLKTLPDYEAYMKETPAFLPRLWKKRL
jgi:protein-S-isoprenylcysteine O-methyltransferase Ste14